MAARASALLRASTGIFRRWPADTGNAGVGAGPVRNALRRVPPAARRRRRRPMPSPSTTSSARPTGRVSVPTAARRAPTACAPATAFTSRCRRMPASAPPKRATRFVRPAGRGFIPAAASTTRSPPTAAATPISTPRYSIARNSSPAATCNGRDQFGLARIDVNTDPTLRPGDIVATRSGLVAVNSDEKQSGGFRADRKRPRRPPEHA